MNRLGVSALRLDGLKLISRERISDRRGWLCRVFCFDDLAPAGWPGSVMQLNHSFTIRRGTVRGMHFQYTPYTDVKLVSCIRGEIWDVAIDLRAGSATLLQWHAELLSAENRRALLIPAGFAHGFQTLTDDVELIYCHSARYVSESEGGVSPTDPKLGITWPIHISEMSDRDAAHPTLDDGFAGVRV